MHYGYVPASVTERDMLAYGRALLIVVGADGTVSEAEWRCFIETAEALGMPLTDDVLRQLRDFDFRNADIADFLRFAGFSAQSLLYDAILIASVDGYAKEERAMAARFAQKLGVDTAVLAVIEAIVETEAVMRNTKGRLFHGDAR
jgi:tellurite resistance protein